MRVMRGSDWEEEDNTGGEFHVGTVTQVLSKQKVQVLWDTAEESTCRAGLDVKFELRIFVDASGRHAGKTCAVCGEEGIAGMLWRCQDCKDCCLCSRCYYEDKHEMDHKLLCVDTQDIRELSVLKLPAVPRMSTLLPGDHVQESAGSPCLQFTSADVLRAHTAEYSMIAAPNVYSSASSNVSSAADDTDNDLRLKTALVIDTRPRQHSEDGERCHLSLQPTRTGLPPPGNDKGVKTSDDYVTENDDVNEDNGGVKSGYTKMWQSEQMMDYKEKTTQTEEKTTQKSFEGKTNDVQSNHPHLYDLSLYFNNMCTDKNETPDVSSDEEQQRQGNDTEKLPRFTAGDIVAIKVAEGRLEELQQSHGGFSQEMEQVIGMTGSVIGVSTTGSIQVQFQRLQRNYLLSPEALAKVHRVQEGQLVRIRPDEDLVKIFNRRVGWKEEMTETLGKVGLVARVDSDGDVLVIFGRSHFLYSPACCLPAPGAHADCLNFDRTTSANSKVARSTNSKVASRAADVANSSVGKKVDVPPNAFVDKDSAVQERNKAMFLKLRETVHAQRSASLTGEDDAQVHHLFNAIFNGDMETVGKLCRRNKSLLASQHRGVTPIMLAASRHSRRVAGLLLDLGADVSAAIPPNRTALGAAMEAKDEDMCCLLIDRGASLEYVDHKRYSYLHSAAFYDLPNVIRTLLAYGADINAKDGNWDTPLLLAVQRGARKAMEALLSNSGIDIRTKNNKGFNALQLASQEGYARAVKMMLEIDKSGVNDVFQEHATSLHLAAITDQAECARLLIINGGASVDPQGYGRAYFTPLHVACHKGHFKTAEALLELGADVHAQDCNGDTPLHLTIGGRITRDEMSDAGQHECQMRVAIACMLISKGAYVDTRNRKGRHPFTYGVTPVREGIGRFMKQNKHLVKYRYGDG